MKRLLAIAIGIVLTIMSLSSLPVSRLTHPLSGTFRGQDLENLRSTIDVTEEAVRGHFFSRIVRSREEESSGCLKVTVTSRFLKESQRSKQDLMRGIYNAWKQKYRGPYEKVIGFVDVRNHMVGIASKSRFVVLP